MATKYESSDFLPVSDAVANSMTAMSTKVGDTFVGILDGKFDVDWIKIDLEAGKVYNIFLTGAAYDNQTPDVTTDDTTAARDVILEIFDSKGGPISKHDDLDPGDGNLDAAIFSFSVDTTGTYYISASSFTGNPAADFSGAYQITVEQVTADITGTPEPDRLIGTDAGQKIKGKGDDDDLQGMGGNDELIGGDGHDLLEGGPGADTLDGGDGNDTISYLRSPMGEAVTINLLTGSARGGDAQGDTLRENLEHVIGAMSAPNTLTGNRGDNILMGGMYADTLKGDRGKDTLSGMGGDDALDGGVGDDTLTGGAGADMLTGGDGDDTVSYAGSSAGVTVRLHKNQAMGGDADGDTYVDMVTVSYELPDEDGVLQKHEETVPDFINVTGSGNADILAGDSRENTINGGDGDDSIYGGPGGGDDELNGGDGNDKLFGGFGDDDLSGDGGNDELSGGPGTDTYKGGSGNDTIYADRKDVTGASADIDGGSNPTGARPDFDTVSFEKLKERSDFIGTSTDIFTLGTDTSNIEKVIGTPNNDFINGSSAKETFEGNDGADTMQGGGDGSADQADTLSYSMSDRRVIVDLQAQTASGGHAQGDIINGGTFSFHHVIGSDHNDWLKGDNTNDNELTGLAGEDDMSGGGGSDTLEGGAGADELDGGTADLDQTQSVGLDSNEDVLSYASSDAGVVVDLSTAKTSGGHAEGDEIAVIRNEYDHDGNAETDKVDVATFESVTGSAHNDSLYGDHRANTLTGGKGDDTLRGGDEQNATNTASGTGAASVITTGDTLIGGPGADTLYGGESYQTKSDSTDKSDWVEHIDTASYEGSMTGVTVNLVTNRGTAGDAAGDRLVDIEKVVGSSKDDTFIASEGLDRIDGGVGADTVSYEDSYGYVHVTLSNNANTNATIAAGGLGTDGKTDNSAANLGNLTTGTAGYDEIQNIENLIGSSKGDTLVGNDVANKLEGGGGKDTLTGNSGNDTLIGGDGDDTLTGNDGNDKLTGSSGDDRMTGNGDADTFIFVHGEKASDDVILDFTTGEDTIMLVGFDIDYDELEDYVDIFNGNVRINLETLGGGKIILQTSSDTTDISSVVDIMGDSAANTDFMIS